MKKVPRHGPSGSGQLELTDAPVMVRPDRMPALTNGPGSPLGGPATVGPSIADGTMESEAEKRERERSTSPSSSTDHTGSRDKVPSIFNIVIGRSGEDNTGGINDVATYEEEMKEIAEEYSKQQKKGRRFVHMRGTKSSNCDLKAIGEALKGEKLYRVNLHGKDGGSVLTNAR